MYDGGVFVWEHVGGCFLVDFILVDANNRAVNSVNST